MSNFEGYLTRSRYEYMFTMRDSYNHVEADAYHCKTPQSFTMRNPEGHVDKHGLGSNPGSFVSGQQCDVVIVAYKLGK